MTVWRKREGAFLQSEVDGETLLITMDEGRILSLEDTARDVWEAIDGARSEGDMAAQLRPRFDGSPDTSERMERDIIAFCASLAAAGLIESAE